MKHIKTARPWHTPLAPDTAISGPDPSQTENPLLLARPPRFHAPLKAHRRDNTALGRYRDIDPDFEEVRLLAPHIATALRDSAVDSFRAPPPV